MDFGGLNPPEVCIMVTSVDAMMDQIPWMADNREK
jgi:hypothetical protein